MSVFKGFEPLASFQLSYEIFIWIISQWGLLFMIFVHIAQYDSHLHKYILLYHVVGFLLWTYVRKQCNMVNSRGAPICKITDIPITYILAKKITDSDIKYRYILIHQLISFHTWNILSLQYLHR